MKPKKDTPDQIYAEQGRSNYLLLLYEWVAIVRALTPEKAIQNPYQESFAEKLQLLPLKEQLLFNDLVECITMMNRQSRSNEKGQLISSRNDNLNALQLVLPKTMQITPRHSETISRLKEKFQQTPFTYNQASVALRCSHSTTKRKLIPLIAHGHIEKLPDLVGKKKKMVLVDNPTSMQAQKAAQSYFEQASEEWKDYRGFTELHYRT